MAKAKSAATKTPVRRTPRERFEKYVAPRTQKVLDSLELLSHCGNRLSNQFDEDDVDKIFGAIRAAVDKAQAVFDTPGAGRNTFTL